MTTRTRAAFTLRRLAVTWMSSTTFLSSTNSLSSTSNRLIRVLYAGHADRFEEYSGSLMSAFDAVGLNVAVQDGNSQYEDPSAIDYIIYARNGPLDDFSPFENARAVLNLFAGVEDVLKNPTIPRSLPLTRMVDPGLKEGMVEYVIGHTLRYHLSVEKLWDLNSERKWRQGESGERIIPPLASQRTVGILGIGELGGACAEALRQLNFRVVGWSKGAKHREGIECFHGTEGLNKVLRQSDVLVLLLPNTVDTENIIRKETLDKCKDGVAIINAGRGSLVNDDDLLEALDSGKVSGATLDVFREEPLPSSHRFWSHPRVLVTPHVAAKTRSDTAAIVIAENILRCENDEPLLYVVDRDAGY